MIPSECYLRTLRDFLLVVCCPARSARVRVVLEVDRKLDVSNGGAREGEPGTVRQVCAPHLRRSNSRLFNEEISSTGDISLVLRKSRGRPRPRRDASGALAQARWEVRKSSHSTGSWSSGHIAKATIPESQGPTSPRVSGCTPLRLFEAEVQDVVPVVAPIDRDTAIVTNSILVPQHVEPLVPEAASSECGATENATWAANCNTDVALCVRSV